MKEQYTHILRVIEQTGPVSSPEEGISMVSSFKSDISFQLCLLIIYSKFYKDFSYKISNIQLKTEDHTDGDFAFIHDASEVRYQYYHNCNFTEVGEPFAEQPLAVAVQQVRYAINQISFVWLSLYR